VTTPLATYVEQRTSILAQAFLTRQEGIYVTTAGGGEMSMFDLVAHLMPGEAENHGRAVRTFGVLTWGTEKAIPNVTAASRLANQRWKKADDVPLSYVPTLALLFSMEDDRGYPPGRFSPGSGTTERRTCLGRRHSTVSPSTATPSRACSTRSTPGTTGSTALFSPSDRKSARRTW
jgi:hypothetical protein